MNDDRDIQRDLQIFEVELRRLEAEYNMFFAGRRPRPPLEIRGRVDALIKRWDRGQIDSLVDRFRFGTLQARYAAFVDLWDRGMRAREEGRPGPFSLPRLAPLETKESVAQPKDRVVFTTSFTNPRREVDKLRSLYESLIDARRVVGEPAVSFLKVAELVAEYVTRLRARGSPEVVFRVAIKDGHVTFTALALQRATN